MKRIGMILAVLVGSVFLAGQALAGAVYFNAAGAESVETAVSGVNCAAVVNSSATGWDHTYVSRDCDQTTDEAFIWHLHWQPDMPTTGTVIVSLTQISASGSGDSRYDVDIGCETSLGTTGLTYGAVSSATNSLVATAYTGVHYLTVALPADISANRYCAVRVRRDANHAGDTLAADVKTRGAYITY